jgi:hypothetical protein
MTMTTTINFMTEDPSSFMSEEEIRAETAKYVALMRDAIARGLVLRRNLVKDFVDEVAMALVALKEHSQQRGGDSRN